MCDWPPTPFVGRPGGTANTVTPGRAGRPRVVRGAQSALLVSGQGRLAPRVVRDTPPPPAGGTTPPATVPPSSGPDTAIVKARQHVSLHLRGRWVVADWVTPTTRTALATAASTASSVCLGGRVVALPFGALQRGCLFLFPAAPAASSVPPPLAAVSVAAAGVRPGTPMTQEEARGEHLDHVQRCERVWQATGVEVDTVAGQACAQAPPPWPGCVKGVMMACGVCPAAYARRGWCQTTVSRTGGPTESTFCSVEWCKQ